MKNMVFLLALICFPIESIQADVRFFTGTLSEAKKAATQQGKMLLVEFGADWCAPCRWMDKYTYNDPELSRYANEYYLSVRIDVDDRTGYLEQQNYKVKLLPTLLILDPSGKVVERQERALSPRPLLELLRRHNRRPSAAGKAVALRTSSGSIPQAYDASGQPLPGTGPAQPEPAAPSLGLYQVDSDLLQYRGYSVQVGAFSKQENVIDEVERLEKQLGQVDILLSASFKNNRPLFLVLAGRFLSKADAQAFQKRLKAKGINGIVKNLADLK